MDPEIILIETEVHMEESVKHFVNEIKKINVGAANPAMLQDIKVNYFEIQTPIREIASIVVPEARQILIKPYDKKLCKEIIYAIIADKGLGFVPRNEGDQIRITIPVLTLERRQQFVKKLKNYIEAVKVKIRLLRQENNKKLKQLELSDDELKDFQSDIQELTDKFIEKIEKISIKKEAELIKV